MSEALDDDLESARSLAEASHREFSLQDLNVDSFPPEEDTIELKNIGIWIDPIGKYYKLIIINIRREIKYNCNDTAV